ncbi:hypothetical protein [Vibrio cincinnatiensis]|uniref:hypothetical protein n=1 Tax=Vibrio cincinnatiensis TaxID=675 RepID=UPI0013027C97|nr:hypothetical protein [Vibrio cincinnatiensis]
MAKAKKSQQGVSWAQAFRDIILRSMDRGQLLPVLIFLIVLALIFKMPEDKVYDFGLEIVNGFKNFSLVGWVLAIIVGILWAGHARIMRRQHSTEYKRIGLEKSKLQRKAADKTVLNSSDS